MPAPLGPREIWELRSEETGIDYALHLSRSGPDPQALLLLTDADAMFGLTVDAVRMLQLPGLVGDVWVAGIGYPGGHGFQDTMEPRMRDLTPSAWEWVPGGGGGPAFARFIVRQVLPQLRTRCGAAADDVTYFGHSLGGLFGTHLLLEHPHAFRRWLISSPSLWWGGLSVLEHPALADPGELRGEVFFGIGGLETDEGRREEARFLPDDHPMKPPGHYLDMVEDLRRFVTRLREVAPQALAIDSLVIEDEYHATVPWTVLTRGLRAFPPSR